MPGKGNGKKHIQLIKALEKKLAQNEFLDVFGGVKNLRSKTSDKLFMPSHNFGGRETSVPSKTIDD